MMALQLQRCGEWSRDALPLVFKPPWRGNKKRGHGTRPRAFSGDESLRSTLLDTESGNGSRSKLTAAAERWKGNSPGNFVAGPRYSSLLKVTRRRRHEVRMETKERMYWSISDWVSRRVNDPLVEIDPVTVHKAILAEEEGEEVPVENDADSSPTVSTTASPSLFGYLPPGFPKGADTAAMTAAIVLLLAALATWGILALRGKQNSGFVPVVASAGQDENGSVTNGGARQERKGDKSAGWPEPSVRDSAKTQPLVPIVASSPVRQTTALRPIPQYSTALAPADLPLPPSFGSNTKDKKIKSPPSEGLGSSSPDDELVLPLVPPNDRHSDDQHRRPEHHSEDQHSATGDENISSNGVVKGDRLLKEADGGHDLAGDGHPEEVTAEHELAGDRLLEEVAAEPELAGDRLLEEVAAEPELGGDGVPEQFAAEHELAGTRPPEEVVPGLANEELAPSPSQEELGTGTIESREELGESGRESISEPAVSEGHPSASELLSQNSGEEEYILIGESNSLSPVETLPRPVEPIAALPAKADVGVPVDSILAYDSAPAQHPSEDLSPDTVDVISTLTPEEVPAAAVFTASEESQAASDAGFVEERRKDYAQALEKVFPAVSVGAGVAALSSFSGVDGALQVVGALATASFLKEYIWAGPREQLLDEIRSIKTHQELKQFLVDKDILPQSWSH